MGPEDGALPVPVLLPVPWRLTEPPPPEALPPGWGSEGARLCSPHGMPLPLLLLLDRREQAPLGRPVTADPRSPAGLRVDAAEGERASRFRSPDDRQRFLLGRAALRQLLGAWLDRDPASLRFRYGPHGKPALAGREGPQFNLAHSGDLILLALHPQQAVGVDVEQRRPHLAWPPIAARVLSSAERSGLQSLPAEAQADGFLRLWCRLEARLKASGEGLAGLERLRRQADASGPAGPACEPLWDVAVPEGYSAAVALAPPA